MPADAPSPPDPWPDLRVALAHDWLTGMRGGERVLELIADRYPGAPLYTMLHRPGSVSPAIERHPIHTSVLQAVPGIARRYRWCLPLMPAAARTLRPHDVDLLISTSHCVAKSVRPPAGATHLCYCFTPMRYAWTFYEEYFGRNPAKKAVVAPLLSGLRRWDRGTADRVDRFIAISRHIRERIRAAYNRDADIIYPPVDTDRCTPLPGGGSRDYDLIVSALVPYKRIDLAVQAYNTLGYPLKIIGVGTEYDMLRKIAAPNIQFLGWQSDEHVVQAYRHCRCLVFPGEEDFGIVPVEAQACGRPVVAYGRGGAMETVVPGETGILFAQQSRESLLHAVEECAGHPWDPALIRRHARQFSTPRFLHELGAAVRDLVR